MSDRFLELETDEDAIASFRGAQNARTSAVLCDAQFDADVELAIAVLENPDAVNRPIRAFLDTLNGAP